MWPGQAAGAATYYYRLTMTRDTNLLRVKADLDVVRRIFLHYADDADEGEPRELYSL